MSKLLITIGLMAMVAFSLVLFMVFAQAYFSPAKAVIVKVNSFGEAEAEMFMLSLLVPLSIVSSAFVLRRMDHQERESYILHSLAKESAGMKNSISG
jgi:uncharacterized membrane protein